MFSGVVPLASGGAIAANAVNFTDNSYTNTVTSYRGLSAVAYVVISSPGTAGADKTASRDLLESVVVKSTLDPAGFPIDLIESATPGLFYGSFGFANGLGGKVANCEHPLMGRVLGTCKVPVDPSAATNVITVTSGTMSSTINWVAGDTGTFKAFNAIGADITPASADILGYTGSMTLQVDDKDLNTATTGVESYPSLVRVFSTSEPQGEFVPIRETGPNTHIYQGTVQFESARTAASGLLYVVNQDKITATYDNAFNTAGDAIEAAIPTAGEWTFNILSSGELTISRLQPASYFGASQNPPNAAGLDRAMVTVFDADENTGARQDTVTVHVISGADATGIDLPLVEIAGNPGFFVGTLLFSQSGSLESTGTVRVGGTSDTFTITYADATTAAGTQAVRTVVGKWRATTTGVVTLGTGAANQIMTGYTTTHAIRVLDADANRNPNLVEAVTVRIKTSSDPASLVLTISETGPDSGDFLGNFQFTNPASPTAGKAPAADADWVVAAYDDASDATAKPATIRNGNGPYGGAAVFRTARTGDIKLDAATYYYQGTTPPTTVANIIVVDQDRNFPTVPDTVTVTAVTLESTPKSVDVTLREIGVDSGVFTGELRFRFPGGGAGLEVSASSTTSLRAEYSDPISAEPGETEKHVSTGASTFVGSPALPTARLEAVHVDSVGSHFERQDVVRVGATGTTTTVTLAGYGSAPPAGVEVRSVICGSKTITLDASIDHLRRSSQQLTLSIQPDTGFTCSAASNTLGVKRSDTITMTISGSPAVTATTTPTATESLKIVEKDLVTEIAQARGGNYVSYVKYVANAPAEETGARDVVVVDLTSKRTPGQTTQLTLVEDAPDSGVFTSSFVYTQVDSDPQRQANRAVRTDAFPLHRPLASEDSSLFGGGLFDRVTATPAGATAPSDFANWVPLVDGIVAAPTTLQYGTGATYPIELSGDDGQTGRFVMVTPTQVGSTAAFTVTNAMVSGSEVVYGVRQEYASRTTAMVPDATLFTIQMDSFNAAAEPIVDTTGEGAISCADVTIVFARRQTFMQTTPQTAATGTCESTSNFATGTIDAKVAGCTAGTSSPTADKKCEIALSYKFRAQAVSAANVYSYVRSSSGATASGIVFGAPPTDPGATTGGIVANSINIDYAGATRTSTVRSLTSTGAVADADTVTLTFDGPTEKFLGAALVETVAGAGNGKIAVGPSTTSLRFTFGDSFLSLDGKPADATFNHFRNVPVAADWRPSVEGVVEFRTPNFAAAAAAPLYGPCVAVRVSDLDSDVTPQLDTLVITARPSSDGSQQRTLTLRETSPGVFQGIIPIQGCGMPNDITMNAGVLVASFPDLHGAAGTPVGRDATILWRPSQKGVITLTRSSDAGTADASNPIRGVDNGLTITLVDSDANTRSNVPDTVPVQVVSDDDTVGVTVILTETSADSKTFGFGPLRFRQPSDPVDPARLRAKLGDKINAFYADPRDDNGNPVTVTKGPTSWVPSFSGVVSIDYDFFVGAGDASVTEPPVATKRFGLASGPGLFALAQIIVADGDKNADPRAVDLITDANGLGNFAVGRMMTGGNLEKTAELIELVETGANTGLFLGLVAFTDRTVSDTATDESLTGTIKYARVPLGASDQLSATYVDSTLASGSGSFKFRDEAKWNPAGTGVITFDKSSYKSGDTVTFTVYDSSFAGNAPASDSIPVRITSPTDTQDLALTVAESTGDAGVFSSTFVVAATHDAATKKLKVASEDTFRLFYEDAAPASLRSLTGIVSGDTVIPTTSISYSLTPNAAGYFTQQPTITLTPDRAVTKREFRFGTTGPYTVYTGPFQLGEGSFTLYYRSVGQAGTETPDKLATIKIDLTNPTSVVAGVQGFPIAAGKVKVNWTALPTTITSNLFEFKYYAVFRDGAAAPIGTATTNEYTDTTVTDEVAHTYRVAVFDESGRNGALSATVTVTPDKTLPTVSGLVVAPTSFDVRAKPAAGISVTVTATDANLASVKAALLPPSGVEIVNITLTGTGTSKTGAIPVTAVLEPCACKVKVTATDVAGNVATVEQDVLVTGPDVSPPEAAYTPENAQVLLGDPLSVTVTDNVGLSSVSWTLDGGVPNVVTVPAAATTVSFTVPTTGLALGAHSLVIVARDNATDVNGAAHPNEASLTKAITVLERPTDLPPPVGQAALLQTQATPRSDGKILVEWTVPADVAALNVGGFQVWRAASPFVRIKNLDGPSARSYVDDTAEKGKTYRYVASYFLTTPIDSLALASNYPAGGDDAITQSSDPVVASKEGLPTWFYPAIGGVAVVAVVVLVVVMIVSRRGRGGATQQLLAPPGEAPLQGEADLSPPETEWAGERHSLRCPECSHRFEVQGMKPIVTNCPQCGRKGILR